MLHIHESSVCKLKIIILVEKVTKKRTVQSVFDQKRCLKSRQHNIMFIITHTRNIRHLFISTVEQYFLILIIIYSTKRCRQSGLYNYGMWNVQYFWLLTWKTYYHVKFYKKHWRMYSRKKNHANLKIWKEPHFLLSLLVSRTKDSQLLSIPLFCSTL